jgi:hypothetical protein
MRIYATSKAELGLSPDFKPKTLKQLCVMRIHIQYYILCIVKETKISPLFEH